MARDGTLKLIHGFSHDAYSPVFGTPVIPIFCHQKAAICRANAVWLWLHFQMEETKRGGGMVHDWRRFEAWDWRWEKAPILLPLPVPRGRHKRTLIFIHYGTRLAKLRFGVAS